MKQQQEVNKKPKQENSPKTNGQKKKERVNESRAKNPLKPAENSGFSNITS